MLTFGVYSKTWETSTREHTPDLGFFGVFWRRFWTYQMLPVDLTCWHSARPYLFWAHSLSQSFWDVRAIHCAGEWPTCGREGLHFPVFRRNSMAHQKYLRGGFWGGYQPPIPSSPRQKCHTNWASLHWDLRMPSTKISSPLGMWRTTVSLISSFGRF